jgi:ribonuclease P protein component
VKEWLLKMEEKYSHAEGREGAKNLVFPTKNDLNNSLSSARFMREERLKSRKIIEQLFREGKVIHGSCLTFFYLPLSSTASVFPVQAMFTGSKRLFRHATDRNHLKRRMREAYRLEKQTFYEKISTCEKRFAVCFVYKLKTKISYAQIAEEMKRLIQLLFKRMEA